MQLVKGDYYIHNASSTGNVLSIQEWTSQNRGARNNGANVGVRAKDGTDNQVWQVSIREDGTYQICSRFTGKSLDTASTSSGSNVQMWTDNPTRNQRWVVTDSGSTVTIGGTSYPTYTVVLDGTSMRLSPSGTNAVLGSSGTWAFVPVPPLQSGGIYELVLRLDKRFALDVSSGSQANSANVILTGRHDANDHKWLLMQYDTDKWYLRNIAGGTIKREDGTTDPTKFRAAQVDAGRAEAKTNVTQWTFSESNPKRWLWKPVSFGADTVNGKECEVVKLYSWVDEGSVQNPAQTFVLDANQNSKLDLGNVCIVVTDPDNQGQWSQEWCLYPTRATDPSMAIPSDLGWVRAVGDEPSQTRLMSQEALYPSWVCTDAWATSGPNHYEWRWRMQHLDATKATWNDWEYGWTPWETALVTIDGTRAWVTEGLPATYDTDLYKGIHYQYEVRTVGVGETAAVNGKSVTGDVYAFVEPVTSLSNAGFGPAGLRMDYDSDYAGTNRLFVTSIKRDGKELIANFYGDMFYTDNDTSVTIPTDILRDWIDDGDQIEVSWRVGNDQMFDFGETHTATLTVSYDAGSGTTLTPEVTMGRGRKLHVDLNSDKPIQKLYLRLPTGEITECKASSDGTFSVEYPFGTGFELFAMCSSTDQDVWDYWHGDYGPSSELLLQYPPCHAWDWDGGSFLLECNTDPLLTDRTLSAIYEADALNKREWQSVYFAHTIQSEWVAEGLLYTGVTESVKADLIALMKQRHVRYRAPSGEVANVAITDVSYQTHREYTTVTVNMIEETL